jgi:hypothetical protein
LYRFDVLGVSCAVANIGKTYKQSFARNVKPHHHAGNVVWWYLNDDFSIGATFEDAHNRCDSIAYEKWNGSFTEDILLTLISSNTPSNENATEYPTTDTGGRFWISSKSHRTFLLMIRQGNLDRNAIELSVWTQGHHQRIETAMKAAAIEEAPAIDQLPTI